LSASDEYKSQKKKKTQMKAYASLLTPLTYIRVGNANERQSTQIKDFSGCSVPKAHKQNICVHLRSFAFSFSVIFLILWKYFRIKPQSCLILFAAFIIPLHATAEITLLDDTGQAFVFDKPVQRIISLAPHITENLFAAGATNQIIATVTYSDYDEQAKRLPVIGDHSKYDLEAIIKLKPELIIAWKSGNPVDQVQQLKQLGFKIFVTDAYALEDVAKNIIAMGKIMATEVMANVQAEKYLSKLQALTTKHKNKKQLSVFYQIWNEPLITINKKHIISHVINLCGGRNVFEDLAMLAPRVSIESVIMKNPDVIVAGMAKGRQDWLKNWQQWKILTAVKKQQLFTINADWITRHTEKMCAYLDKARGNLNFKTNGK